MPTTCRSSRHTRADTAFTLIELLIVVAIIAILAAIAVPNLLEAQIRSKVSRVKADLRTLATAIESYTVDWNHCPYDGDFNSFHYGWATSQFQFTTPIAYVASIPADVFQDPAIKNLEATAAPGQTNYVDDPADTRHSYDYGTGHWQGVGQSPEWTTRWWYAFGNSPWKVGSCGPDKIFNNDPGGSHYGFNHRYDPTNGTISDGDIYRSQGRVD